LSKTKVGAPDRTSFAPTLQERSAAGAAATAAATVTAAVVHRVAAATVVATAVVVEQQQDADNEQDPRPGAVIPTKQIGQTHNKFLL